MCVYSPFQYESCDLVSDIGGAVAAHVVGPDFCVQDVLLDCGHYYLVGGLVFSELFDQRGSGPAGGNRGGPVIALIFHFKK